MYLKRSPVFNSISFLNAVSYIVSERIAWAHNNLLGNEFETVSDSSPPLQFFLSNAFNVSVEFFKQLVSIGHSPWSISRFLLGLIFMSPYLWCLDFLLLSSHNFSHFTRIYQSLCVWVCWRFFCGGFLFFFRKSNTSQLLIWRSSLLFLLGVMAFLLFQTVKLFNQSFDHRTCLSC